MQLITDFFIDMVACFALTSIGLLFFVKTWFYYFFRLIFNLKFSDELCISLLQIQVIDRDGLRCSPVVKIVSENFFQVNIKAIILAENETPEDVRYKDSNGIMWFCPINYIHKTDSWDGRNIHYYGFPKGQSVKDCVNEFTEYLTQYINHVS